MKQFVRLLFICFGLLVLLGLNEKESADSNSDQLASSTRTFREFCVCTPASSGFESAEYLTAGVARQLSEHLRLPGSQPEQSFTTGIHTRILSSRDRYMGFYPDILKKTGQALHLAARRGDPLPA